MEQKGITKQQSGILQGAAILLMIYHHFFSNINVYGDMLQFGHLGMVRRMAWFGKICVGIFAFVSGYGMSRVFQKYGSASRDGKQKNTPNAFGKELVWVYRTCLRQILKLLQRYWCILLFFMSIFFLLGKVEFIQKEFWLNFFCVKTTYNGAFWYVEQYVKMLLLLPIFHLFVEGLARRWGRTREEEENGDFEKGWFAFYELLFLALVLWECGCIWKDQLFKGMLWALKALRPAFLLCIFCGYLLARLHVYEWFFGKTNGWKRIWKVVTGLTICAVVVAIRIWRAHSASYAMLDFVLVPLLAGGLLMITEEGKGLGACLQWIGGLTVYLWLTHLFVYDLTMDFILTFVDHHFLFYVLETILCIVIAWICRWLERMLEKLLIRKKKKKG